jgi:hypothetical protein
VTCCKGGIRGNALAVLRAATNTPLRDYQLHNNSSTQQAVPCQLRDHKLTVAMRFPQYVL